MPSIKVLVLGILAFFSFKQVSQAQFRYSNSYFEAGIMGGIMNYSGELTNSIMDFKHVHLAGAIFGRYNLNPFVSFRAQLALGSLSGDDKDAKELRNQIRNLHFRSHLFEGSLNVEFNLLGYRPRGHERMISPYVFVGIGIFNMNPKARFFDPTPGLGEDWRPLRDFRTEGQQDAFPDLNLYNKTQVSIPMGAGVKFAINSHLNLGIEIGFRKTFTDYIDDVSNTYMYDALSDQYMYEAVGETPYNAGFFGDKSARELMADRTPEYVWEQAVANGTTVDPFGVYLSDPNNYADYETYVVQRGGKLQRGDKAQDWYVFTAIFISYNFIDNGLVGARKRRKRKAGCKSSRF
ncbi:MAG: DUF6089 family protein [Saprospiraceae bacterium]|nr:DUF6089 family protein [Saprospiraceae bacterium]